MPEPPLSTPTTRSRVLQACLDLAASGQSATPSAIHRRLPDLSHSNIRKIRSELIRAGEVPYEAIFDEHKARSQKQGLGSRDAQEIEANIRAIRETKAASPAWARQEWDVPGIRYAPGGGRTR